MKRKLPVFELVVNEDENSIVDAIALVEHPAIESDFMFFSKVEEIEFSTNDERMELLGAAMIPDKMIYRIDKTTNAEYDVFFSSETIRHISQTYFKNGFQKNLNLNHTSIPAKSYIFQSYIVDTEKGLFPPKGIDVPNGSWIVGVKVDDAKVWEDIKSGKVKGFSIEGIFQFIEKNNNDDAEVMEILQRINQIINKIKK